MVFFDKEAQKLRARWKTMDTKAVDFAASPFGMTKDGLQDFRGYTVSGSFGAKYIISKKRFEKCDLSFSRFTHCKIINSWFISSKLYAVDFHSCEVIDCPQPNCKLELIVPYQEPGPPANYFEQKVKQWTSLLDEKFLKVRTLDQLTPSDFDKAVFYCLSLKSAPSVETLEILSHILAQSKCAVPLIVLDQEEFSNTGKPEKELINLLFSGSPCGLGEVAWVQAKNIISTQALAKTPMREIIIDGLELLGVKAGHISKEMAESRFWEIINQAKPDESPYSAEAHGNRLREALKALSDKELKLFNDFRLSLLNQSFTFEMATVASIIGTGCDDGGLTDFGNALIYRGQRLFYDALKNPDDALVQLDGAHHLLLEGFGYLVRDEIDRRPTLAEEMIASVLPGPALGGAHIEEEEKAFRKHFPKLFKKYWGKDEFRVSGTL
jgi:Protein of unknown function (DUF4240)